MTTKAISSAVFAGLFASVAVAQSPTAGPRWSAYAGCWEPVVAEGQPMPTNSARVCVVPSSDLGADLITIVDKKITERTHVEADGARHDVKRQGCEGWESAAWSANGSRLYFNGDQQCRAGFADDLTLEQQKAYRLGVQRKTSGVFAIEPSGQWTNIVNVTASGGHALRALRYAPVSIDSTYPAEIFSALGNRDMFFSTARIASRPRITLDDVIEASKALDPAVVEAWLSVAEQKFSIDAKALVRLSDAGVPPGTIDIMIAVSNPAVFAVASNASGVSTSAVEMQRAPNSASRDQCLSSQIMDPWGYYDSAFCEPYRGYGYYGSRRGYLYDPYYSSMYGSRYGNPYGYGYGYNYGYNQSPIVIIVRGATNEPEKPHGRMTRNGYVNDASTTAASSRQSTERPSGSSGSGSSGSGSGSSGSSGSGSSSSGSASSGRTAHAKPPTT